MFFSAHHDPAIIRAAMGCAMNLVNACCEALSVRKESLSVCENLGIRGRSDASVEVVISNDLNKFHRSIWHNKAHRQDLMIAMSAATLTTR